MKSNQIVSLFLARKDKFGTVGLTKKQVSWLSGQLMRECKSGDLWRDKHHPITVWDAEGTAHHFVIYPQGGGFIKPQPKVEMETKMADEHKQKYLEAAAKFREMGNTIAAEEIEKAVARG